MIGLISRQQPLRPYTYQPKAFNPLWERASNTALLAFSCLADGCLSCIKNGKQITVTFSADRSTALIRMMPPPQAAKVPFAEALVNPFLVYTESDKANVEELLRTFDDSSVLSLSIVQFRLAEIGDRIAHLHPMTFMKIAMSDSVLRSRMDRIFNNTFKRLGLMHGNGIREGFKHQLDRESNRNALEPNIEAFAASLQLPADEIRRLIQTRSWTDLYFYLIQKTSAQEAQSCRE